MNLNHLLFRATGLIFFGASPLLADVRMPAIFGDHMVLQQATRIPVWGWAAAGEQVEVTLGPSSASTKADANGNWRVDLPPEKQDGNPRELTVAGNNRLNFEDVLVGEVWVCSGQSNMGYAMAKACNAKTEIPKANDPQLRLFLVGLQTSLEPLSDATGHWQVCTPETLPPFSGLGYYFGKELRATLKRPVGLIGSYWGGTPAEAWTSLMGLRKEPAISHYVDAYEKIKTGLPEAIKSYPKAQAAYDEAMKKWNAEDAPAYNAAKRQWNAAAARATTAGAMPPPKPGPAHPQPTPPAQPDGGPKAGSTLFNGMVAPLIPFNNRGGGLIIGAPPWVPTGEPPAPAAELRGFIVAGEDRNFVPADAKISGATVVVSSPRVPKPAAVRYGWDNISDCNLYNKERLPTSPFRTDEWN